MGLGDCVRCIKYLLFVFNLIFCIVGLSILGLGVWIYVAPHTIGDTIPSDAYLKSFPFIGLFFIIIGAIIATLGFLGCCGAVFENRVLLVLFFILLLLVFLALLAAGIFAVLLRGPIREGFSASFDNVLNPKSESYNVSKEVVQVLEIAWECCGWTKAERHYTDSGMDIPNSCREGNNATAPLHKVPCSKQYDEHVDKNGVKVIVAVFVTAVIAFLGLIFSMLLCCAISE